MSFDEDSADDLDDFDEAMEGQSSERPAEQRSERRERVSETRRVITRTSRQGGEQSNFVSVCHKMFNMLFAPSTSALIGWFRTFLI